VDALRDKRMATSRLGSAVVGYNVQTAVAAKHHLIVTHEVTNSVTDRGQLAAMATAAKEAGAHPNPIMLADRGYFEGYEILECERTGIATMVPKPLTSNSKFEGRFDKRDFTYDRQRDEYRCPAGQSAIYRLTASRTARRCASTGRRHAAPATSRPSARRLRSGASAVGSVRRTACRVRAGRPLDL
jgi:hypothetical protein